MTPLLPYSLKYKHWKNKFLDEQINSSVGRDKNQNSNSTMSNSNNTMSVMLCMGVTFVKKNSCLVARTDFV